MPNLRTVHDIGKRTWIGVVLDDESRNKLLDIMYKYMNPYMKGWAIRASHLTMNFGELTEELEKHIGEKANLTVNAIGKDEKTFAVRVSTDLPIGKNVKVKHITLAFDPVNGAGGKYSNDLTDWKPIENVELHGVVKEGHNSFPRHNETIQDK